MQQCYCRTGRFDPYYALAAVISIFYTSCYLFWLFRLLFYAFTNLFTTNKLVLFVFSSFFLLFSSFLPILYSLNPSTTSSPPTSKMFHDEEDLVLYSDEEGNLYNEKGEVAGSKKRSIHNESVRCMTGKLRANEECMLMCKDPDTGSFTCVGSATTAYTEHVNHSGLMDQITERQFVRSLRGMDLQDVSDSEWIVVRNVFIHDDFLDWDMPYANPELFQDDENPTTLGDLEEDKQYPWAVNMLSLGTSERAEAQKPDETGGMPVTAAQFQSEATQIASARELHPGDNVKLLAIPETGGSEPVVVGSGVIFPGGDNTIQYNIDGLGMWELPPSARGDHHPVVIWRTSFDEKYWGLRNRYYFQAPETQQPKVLKDYKTMLRTPWALEMMLPENAPAPAPTAAPSAVEEDEDVITPVPSKKKSSRAPPKRSTRRTRVAKKATPTPALKAAPSTGEEDEDVITPVPSKKPTRPASTAVLPPSQTRTFLERIKQASGQGDDEEPVVVETQTPAAEKMVISAIKVRNDDYHRRRVLVRFDKITILRDHLRTVDPQNRDNILDSVKSGGIDPALGVMTVTLTKVQAGKSAEDSMEDTGTRVAKVDLPMTLVDGGHRQSAITSIRADPSVPQARRDELEWVECVLMWRKDGVDMSKNEILEWSKNLNVGTGRAKAMDLGDKLHGIMSFIRNHCEDHGLDPREFTRRVSSNSIAMALRDSQHLQDTALRQRSNYVAISHACVRNDMNISEFMRVMSKESVTPGVTHLSSPILLALDRLGMELGAEAVAYYISNIPGRGKFEDVAQYFYEHFRDYYAELRTLAIRFKARVRDIPHLLNTQVEFFSKGRPLSVRRALVASCGKFPPKLRGAPSAKLRKAWEASLKRFVNAIVKHMEPAEKPTPVLPKPPTPPPSPRGKRKRTATVRTVATVEAPQPARKRRKALTTVAAKKVAGKKPVQAAAAFSTRPAAGEGVSQEVDDPGEQSDASTERGSDHDYYDPDVHVEGAFDDIVPALLPFGYQDRPLQEKYPKKGDARWLGYSSMLPSMWTQPNEIVHVDPWLRALYIPERHNASGLSAEDLKKVHEIVFLHLARCRHEELQTSSTNRLVAYYPTTQRETPVSALVNWTPTTRSAVAAKDLPVLAYDLIGAKRMELQSVGYCIFPGLLTDKEFPSEVFSDVLLDEDGDVVRNLMDFFMERFPGEEKMGRDENRGTWRPIINKGVPATDNADSQKGASRFSTTKEGMVGFEQDQDKQWVVRKRALLDARLGQILRALNLDRASAGMWDDPDMSIPRTGGRFLLTGKGCGRQTPHQDFQSRSRADFCPGYFMIGTGVQPTPLWVCDYSHTFTSTTKQAARRFSKAASLKKVKIPPFSVFVGRGDLTHAGAAYEDSQVKEGLIRYHLYFAPRGVRIEDGVHRFGEFRPRFEEEGVDKGSRTKRKSPETEDDGGAESLRGMSSDEEEVEESSGS